ncbi:hypothetical protein TWF696_000962 [Orbilia brochopaga]|uniref:SHSP domain-containing protein n=1 Tax=Orbilia brochopaga TaxID=3140254 RepID=A0AAV9VFX1_9PEZI
MLSFPRMMSRDIRPWVRLFEDLEASANGGHHHHPSNSLLRSNMTFPSSFTPSFDVKETKDSYVLDGDVPGIVDKSALDLSFVDDNTLVVKGRIERSSESGKPPATPAEKEKKEGQQQPSAEEEGESSASGEKYWVRERYVGEFQRAFSFPQSVDHDAVKASLKDGILSIVVPKKTGPDGPRKITIE